MKKIIFQVLLICGLFLLSFVMMRFLQKSMPFSLGIDLVPRWVGTDAMLDGISPYTHEARQRTWRVIYGTDEPQGNVFGFYYPPAITTLLMPFVLAGVPLDVATAGFSTLIWSAWVLALFFTLRGRPMASFALFLLSGIFFRPAFSNYILGQNTLLCVLLFAAAYLLVQKQKWIPAGLLLGLSLLKPSLMLLPVCALLLLHPNWKFWLSFILINVVLNLPSFFLIGWWVPDFIHEISGYALENKAAWSPAADLLSSIGLLWIGLSVFLILRGFLKKDEILLLSSAFALNAIFTPHTADYDLVVFLFLLFWLDRRISAWVLLVILWVTWVSLFLMTIETWYRFIWLVYPLLILSVSALVEYGAQRQKNDSVKILL